MEKINQEQIVTGLSEKDVQKKLASEGYNELPSKRKNGFIFLKIYAGNDYFDFDNENEKDIPEKFHNLIEFSILASQKDPLILLRVQLNLLVKNIWQIQAIFITHGN